MMNIMDEQCRKALQCLTGAASVVHSQQARKHETVSAAGEIEMVRAAAKVAGQNVSGFIRNAALAAARTHL